MLVITLLWCFKLNNPHMRVVYLLSIFYAIEKKESDLPFELIGAIPVLIKRNGNIDEQILKISKETFSNALFENQIFQRERIKKFGAEGIKDIDAHDKRVLHMLDEIYKELVERIELIEG